MRKLFDIVGTDIILDPRVIAIPDLKVIWDRDKDDEKVMANKELTYITFLCDFLSPYKDLPEEKKESTIRKDIFKNEKWEPDDKIKSAIKKYNELQDTRHLRMLRSLEHVEDKITEYFNTIDLNETDDWGKPKFNISDIVRNAKEMGNIIKSISILEKQVQLDLQESKIRGDSEIGPYEIPKNNNEKEDNLQE